VASPPSIAAVAYNQAGLDADTLARAKSEVMRIYREAGVDVTWMDPATVESASAFAIQLLVRLRAVNASGSVMGRAIGGTHETGGLAFVYYDCVLRSAHEREQDVGAPARRRDGARDGAPGAACRTLVVRNHASQLGWRRSAPHRERIAAVHARTGELDSRQGLRLLRGDGHSNEREPAVVETVIVHFCAGF
jgi:hypothetical protein